MIMIMVVIMVVMVVVVIMVVIMVVMVMVVVVVVVVIMMVVIVVPVMIMMVVMVMIVPIAIMVPVAITVPIAVVVMAVMMAPPIFIVVVVVAEPGVSYPEPVVPAPVMLRVDFERPDSDREVDAGGSRRDHSEGCRHAESRCRAQKQFFHVHVPFKSKRPDGTVPDGRICRTDSRASQRQSVMAVTTSPSELLVGSART